MQTEVFWRSAARSILGVPLRTPVAAMFGDLGWRPFVVRAAHQACSFWTRVTELPKCSLVRQAMAVQRQIVLDAGRADYMSCWLSRLRKLLLKTPLGSSFWDKWFVTPDFNIVCSREVYCLYVRVVNLCAFGGKWIF